MKRQRIAYRHHHNIRPADEPRVAREPAFIEPDTVDKLVLDAIKSIVEEEGARCNIYDPVIESLALTAFRDAVEECMLTHFQYYAVLTSIDILKFCSKVRRSMHAARRTVPIATDFESAIAALDVPRLDDQLKAYQSQVTINPTLLPTPPPDDVFHNHAELPQSLLGPELGAQDALKKFHPNPSFLPPLPSAHTYRQTTVFPERQTDSRRIRELATEEGKLGEQALRKLAGAVKVDAARPVDPETHKQAVVAESSGRKQKRQKKPQRSEAALFEDTMRNLLKAESEGFELGPIVTAEKSYRMPDDGQVKRRTRPDDKGKTVDTGPASLATTDVVRMEGVEVMDL